jgi:WhiB family redox-sensing transcriptional regulator
MSTLDPYELAGLDLLPLRPAWMRDALCREHPEVSFFIERGGAVAAAIAVCSDCLVRAECLRYALDHDERDGIWGGTTPAQRKMMLSAMTPTPPMRVRSA